MDRFVIREPRAGADYPQGNQVMAYSINGGRNNNMLVENFKPKAVRPPENVYYGGSYANQFANMQNVPSTSYMDVAHMNTAVFGQNMLPGQNQMMTGFDRRYMTNYSDCSGQYIVSGQQMQEPNIAAPPPGFGTNYLNTSFAGVDRNTSTSFNAQVIGINSAPPQPKLSNINNNEGNMKNTFQHKQFMHIEQVSQNPVNVTPKKVIAETEVVKKEPQIQVMSRMDRLKALHKSGPRAFSGPVEKVLKWHKALQDIGVFVFYEIVAKCVTVRSGESCAKNLVIRDDNGPAMQVVYYEIDFMLPELKPPCTVRVIGRMMAGTCRLQAFRVRPATGDDVATLPRRAAVAAHHVARLCKEYGINQ